MLRWCRRHLLKSHLILFAAVIIFATLIWYAGDWFLGGSRETFGPLNSYVFIWVSILIALVAALNAMLASSLASEVQRPFLNVFRIHVNWSKHDKQPTNVNSFIIGVINTGVFPADRINILFTAGNDVKKKRKFIMDGKIAQILFPNQDEPNLTFKEDGDDRLIVNYGEKLPVEIEIRYRNKLTNKIHKTIRSYQAQYDPPVNSEPMPLPEGDYWD